MQSPEGKEKLVDIKEMGLSLGREMRPEREVGPDHVGLIGHIRDLRFYSKYWKATEGFYAVE